MSGRINILLLLLLGGGMAGPRICIFSQFFEAPLLRNPSLAGIFTGDCTGCRWCIATQWNSFTNAYKTASFNAEYKADRRGMIF